jgi:hypothetical protein
MLPWSSTASSLVEGWRATCMNEGTQFLVTKLERLMSLPLGSKPERDAWCVESRSVEKAPCERFPNLEFPHEIWHFLADADIRSRDAEYRKYQEQIVTDYIAKAKGEHHAR